MIPIRLQLKNFLSYGADIQTVDFSHYPLICLSGKNGHGKSALLDAITWVIWGQARKIANTSKADQGLVRLGQTQMMVILDFECEGSKYRVKREYMITYGKPVASLEFGIYQENVLVPLTDKTIKDTQSKIEQILNLDYASFTNSAFLRQGHSNEFSKKSPRDRKQILATILGITNYDAIRKAAHDKARQIITQQRVHMALQDTYVKELKTKCDLERQMIQVHKELTALESTEKGHVEQLTCCSKQYQELLRCEQAYIQLQKEYTTCKKQEIEIQESVQSTREELDTLHKQLNTTYNMQTLKEEKHQLLKKDTEYQQCFQQYATLKKASLELQQSVYTLQKTIEQAHTTQMHTFELNLKQYKAHLARLEQEQQHSANAYHEAQKEYDDNTKTINALGTPQVTHSQLHTLQNRQMKQTEEYHRILGRWETTQKELLETQKKENIIRTDSPQCPLCEQELSEERREVLRTTFHRQQQEFLSHRAKLAHAKDKCMQELAVTQMQLEEMQRAMGQEEAHQQKRADLMANQKKTHEMLTQLQQTMLQLDKKIKEADQACRLHIQSKPPMMNELLQTNTEYMSAIAQLNKLKKQLEFSTYHPSEHEAVREHLTEIERHIQSVETRHEHERQVKHYTQQIEQLGQTLQKLKDQKQILEQQLTIYGDSLKPKNILLEKQATLEQDITRVRQERSQCLETKGRLASRHETLAQIEVHYNTLQKELIELEKEKYDYQLIATATGKDGIQALLIEHALPEIEQEANTILARLTDNQTTIMLESLRDLKKGGTKETLDIKISDASGIRPYELFSGGEAFRIDFALRIAISKLLARRAGSSMQTLIIDEGFGSQDEQGLNNIMEAIYAIQNDFNKIIIVSHLSSMKSQFPVHFVIHKHASGSEVHIVEQG
jgi:DNA repair protein SbcC/Rad50